MVRWSRVGQFYAVAVAGMMGVAAVLPLVRDNALASTAVAASAMFTPLLGTVIVHRVHGEPALGGLGRLRLSRWLGVASVLALVVSFGALLVGVALPGVTWDPGMEGMFERFAGQLTPEQVQQMRASIEQLPVHPLVLAVPQALIAGATVNALFAFGEEVGWRGFLQRELAPLGFWRASLLTGALWGLWHAPLILQGHNYPVHRVEGVFLFTGVCMLLAPLHSWVRLRGDTVWAAAVLHGTFNASAGVALMVVRGPELLVGVQGVAGLITLAVANLALALGIRRDPPTLPHPPTSGAR